MLGVVSYNGESRIQTAALSSCDVSLTSLVKFCFGFNVYERNLCNLYSRIFDEMSGSV